MTANKTVCRIKQSILYLTFLLLKFADTVLVTIVDILFVYNRLTHTCYTYVIALNTLTFVPFDFLRTYTFADKLSKVLLQVPLHLSRLIMNG